MAAEAPDAAVAGKKAKALGPLTQQKSNELMEDISLYAEQQQIKQLLGEYLKRVVLHKPDNPIKFLIDEITNSPFEPGPPPAHPADLAAEAAAAESSAPEKLDLRRPLTKVALLRKIFDSFDTEGRGAISRARLLVALKSNPTILLEAFPLHATRLPALIEHMKVDKGGLLAWDTLREETIEFLGAPGR